MDMDANCNTQAVQTHLLSSHDPENGLNSRNGSRIAVTHPRVRWVVGTACCLLCVALRSITAAGLLEIQEDLLKFAYTKSAIRHAAVLWLTGCHLYVVRRSPRLQSSQQFFLIVSAIALLGVAELFMAHATTFTPLMTRAGLSTAWTMAGSVMFVRLLNKWNQTIGHLVALILTMMGCLLVSKPGWFINEGSLDVGRNSSIVSDGYVSNLTTQFQVYQSAYMQYYQPVSGTTQWDSMSTVNAREPVVKIAVTQSPTEVAPHQGSSRSISITNNSSLPNQLSMHTLAPSAHAADELIGCIIVSISGLFFGGWLTVVTVMSDLSLSVLLFWSSMACGVMLAMMLLTGELTSLSLRSIQVLHLLIESFGGAAVLCSVTVGARLTTPIVAAVLLTLSLLVSPKGPHLYNTQTAMSGPKWPKVAGGILLIAGVALTYGLEMWMRHRPQKRKCMNSGKMLLRD